jgi:ParE-like toxin of type II ParDE toxin-antitoxin system
MKKYNVIFSASAIIDIEEAVIYYNEQQKNLGKKFAKEIRSTLNSIKRNPFYASIRYADIRCAVVPVFPFLIHYHIETETKKVRILSVYNTYRKPLW